MSAQPIRTCQGCRQRGPRSTLLRLVADQSTSPVQLVPDAAACLPGRGAWVHPKSSCVAKALARGGLARALRVPGPFDGQALVAAVAGEPTSQTRFHVEPSKAGATDMMDTK